MSSPAVPTYDCYDSVGNPIKARILDLMEPSGYGTGLNTTTVYSRRAVVPLMSANTLPILESVSGWAVSAKFQGKLWAQASSAAATRKFRQSARFLWPLGEDMALEPAASRTPLRHQMEMVIWRTTPLIAAAPLSFGYVTNAAALELSDSTNAGYELVSRSGVNGGRWTVRVRLADNGAVVVVQDTGIDPAVTPAIHAALRYDHALTPRLSCFINGVEYGVLSGVAAVPAVASANSHSLGIVQGLSAGGGVGQIDRTRQCRVWIEEI